MIDEKDLPEDLKGDITPEINPEKLFDEKEYSTIILGSENISKKDGNNADYITVLVNPRTSREEKDEALKALKENKAQAFMLSAITKTKKPEHKASIIAACWETGLDFSNDYLFFIELLCADNFHVSFEAFTVIQEIESEIPKETLSKALDILNNAPNPSVYVDELKTLIEEKLNN